MRGESRRRRGSAIVTRSRERRFRVTRVTVAFWRRLWLSGWAILAFLHLPQLRHLRPALILQ